MGRNLSTIYGDLSPGQTIEQSWIGCFNFARSSIVRPFGQPCWKIFVQDFLFDHAFDRVCFWSNITPSNSARHNNVALFCRPSNKVVSWIKPITNRYLIIKPRLLASFATDGWQGPRESRGFWWTARNLDQRVYQASSCLWDTFSSLNHYRSVWRCLIQ